jgi:tripartite-type tricarboxylate transporter receptor subunit TctC
LTGWLRTGIGVALAAIAADRASAAWLDDRPIEIIVGFQAGSGPDLLARPGQARP